MTLRDAPQNAVRSGFMGVGDAMAPGGYLGILPSIYMGRQAALIAAGALDAGGATARRLAAFNYLTRGPVFRSLHAEGRMLAALAEVTDRQLDHLCQVLDGTRPMVAAGGTWRSLPFASLNWLLAQPALMGDDWSLLEQLAPALGIHGFALGASVPSRMSSSMLLR
jgi:flavin-dependent dehydrogenase